jgi:2-polyprenyl-3-methyl-5-hydroxy-6-metoxy-1,4-benzoquinol methylase
LGYGPPMTSARSLDEIPVGHYHEAMQSGHPVRRAWHALKFKRVLDLCQPRPGSLLDVGCFAGSLLSLASEADFPRQLGVDILPKQIGYAQETLGTPFRRFAPIDSLRGLSTLNERFAFATNVEVIEHLTPAEIRTLFLEVARVLEPQGAFVLSTPNYTSTWPLLELLINKVSDVDYSEQHITKFTYFGVERQLRAIVPEFDRYFRFDVKTTTHLVSPFLAVLGYETAIAAGEAVPHRSWPVPFGNLVLLRLSRTDTPWQPYE